MKPIGCKSMCDFLIAQIFLGIGQKKGKIGVEEGDIWVTMIICKKPYLN